MDIKFYMTVGDWSGDGHAQKTRFLIQSNQSVEFVREVHFGIKSAAGIDIEALCNEYGDNVIPADVRKQLELLGYNIQDTSGLGDYIISPEEMMNIWLFLLMYAEAALNLKICEEIYPDFHFAGMDKKGRHIGAVGYGLFLE